MKTCHRILWSFVLVGLLLAASSASAGRVEDADGKTIIHLTVYQLPDPSDTSTANRAELAGIREYVRRFPKIFAAKYRDKYKANPEKYGRHNWDNVEVRLHAFSGIYVAGVEHDLLAIAGGTAPDILYVNFRRSDNYIQQRFLYPLDKPEDGYMGDLTGATIDRNGIHRPNGGRTAGGMTDAELNFRIHHKIWPIIRRKGPDGEKHVWAVPYGGALGKVMLFRRDLFDEKGIPYPTKDWTWEDLMAAAKKITDPKRGIYGVLLTRSMHEAWYWITWLWSAGGDVMVYNEETDQWRCVFDSLEAAKALEFYTRLCEEKWIDGEGKIRRGYSAKDTSDAWGKWAKGEIAMHFAYIDEKLFNTLNPEVTGMVPVPLGPPGPDGKRVRGGELNSRMMGLFSKIGHPAVRDAAWEYLRWYDCKEARRIKTRIMVEGGLGRFVNPKYLRMFGYPEIERLCPKGWSEVFEIAIETGKPEPYGRNSNLAYELMTKPIHRADALALNDELTWGEEHKQERIRIMHELLKRDCARANELMIGIISPAKRTKRRVVAYAVLAGIVAAFFFVFRRVSKAFQPADFAGRQRARWAFRRYAWAYVLLVPAVLSILLWRYVPLLRGSVMAFQDYRIVGQSLWVGVDNFANLLFDPEWWAAVYNALRYSFLVMFLTFLPPIILAILLQEAPRGKLLFRTIYYLPAVITGLVTVVLWKQFYGGSERGAMNAVVLGIPAIGFVGLGLVALVIAILFARRLLRHNMRLAAGGSMLAGLLLLSAFTSMAGPILFPAGESFLGSLARIPTRLLDTMPEAFRWLGDPSTAMLSCVLPMVWAGMGPGCLIYLAALKGIPDDYYEAADVDGATFIDKILFVVFPILKPLVIINFIGVFIGSWYGATGNILVMTGGAANTQTAGLYIWFRAFTFLEFGPATAAAWLLGSMLIGFTVYQLRILSRVEFRATGAK